MQLFTSIEIYDTFCPIEEIHCNSKYGIRRKNLPIKSALNTYVQLRELSIFQIVLTKYNPPTKELAG